MTGRIDENRLWHVGMRRPDNGGRLNCQCCACIQMSIKQAWINLAGVIIRCSLVSETLNLFGATDEPNNCCPTAETWRSRVDSDRTRLISFRSSAREHVLLPASQCPPPFLLSMQICLFFSLSLRSSFQRWQTVPPVQFSSYYTLKNTLARERGRGRDGQRWMMEGVRPIKKHYSIREAVHVEERGGTVYVRYQDSRLSIMGELCETHINAA